MKASEYATSILPDGSLPIPENVKKELELKPDAMVKVIILKEEKSFDKFISTFGAWKDDRSAKEIIDEIYKNRKEFSLGRDNDKIFT